MDVFFKTERLAMLLGVEQNRIREFGVEGSNRIDLRLQQLMGVPTLAAMKTMPGQCRELTSPLPGYFAVDVSPHCRLTFHPADIGQAGEHQAGRGWHSIESITVSDYQRLSGRSQL